MSETGDEVKTEVATIEEKPVKRGSKRQNKQMTELTKEAEAILKGFNEKDNIPEGRRATRASLRGQTTPVATPPPAKKERKVSTGGTGKRGRPKKVVEENEKAKETVDSVSSEVKDESLDEEKAEPLGNEAEKEASEEEEKQKEVAAPEVAEEIKEEKSVTEEKEPSIEEVKKEDESDTKVQENGFSNGNDSAEDEESSLNKNQIIEEVIKENEKEEKDDTPIVSVSV